MEAVGVFGVGMSSEAALAFEFEFVEPSEERLLVSVMSFWKSLEEMPIRCKSRPYINKLEWNHLPILRFVVGNYSEVQWVDQCFPKELKWKNILGSQNVPWKISSKSTKDKPLQHCKFSVDENPWS